MDNKIQKLISTLNEDGASEEEVAIVLEQMTTSSARELFVHLVTIVEEEEARLLTEIAEDEERSSQFIDEMCLKHEGKTSTQLVDEINSRFIDTFLEGYES